MQTQDWISLLVIIGLTGLALFLYFRFFKLYKIKNIVFIDGALGTGKSFLSVSLAIRLYKRALRKHKIKVALIKAVSALFPTFREKLDGCEPPYLYSNIRLRNIEFVKLTKDLIMRKNFRFNYGSVLLIDEFSLMADQMLWKDREASERLSNFFKLWRHETKGGYIVINSQSTSDLHYSLKYVLSDYLYIHHKRNLPFVAALSVQEMVYCADKDGQHITNARTSDLEDTCKTMLVFKKYHKYYDSYCYSIFTDCLPAYHVTEKNEKEADLKDVCLISFKEYSFLMENIEERRKHENEKTIR